MLVGKLDEDVFEAGSEGTNFGDGNTVFHKLFLKVVEIEMFFDERMNRLTENRGAADAGEVTRESERTSDFGRGNFDAAGALRLNVRAVAEQTGRAFGDAVAVIHVGEVAAAPGSGHAERR